MSTQWRRRMAAPRFTPLLGILIGAAGGAVYWLGVQIWPASIAVILSLLATTLLSAGSTAGAGTHADTNTRSWAAAGVPMGFVFALLVKYNALMALSAANVPFALPANCALGLIMIAGQACSRALLVFVPAPSAAAAASGHLASKPASLGDIGAALAIGFAPAALIGVPGLIGLVGAILARIAIIAHARWRGVPVTAAKLDQTQQLAEICFYLSALDAWSYI
jgi:adenosylcobinamide-GDP ribazoletransferase